MTLERQHKIIDLVYTFPDAQELLNQINAGNNVIDQYALIDDFEDLLKTNVNFKTLSENAQIVAHAYVYLYFLICSFLILELMKTVKERGKKIEINGNTYKLTSAINIGSDGITYIHTTLIDSRIIIRCHPYGKYKVFTLCLYPFTATLRDRAIVYATLHKDLSQVDFSRINGSLGLRLVDKAKTEVSRFRYDDIFEINRLFINDHLKSVYFY